MRTRGRGAAAVSAVTAALLLCSPAWAAQGEPGGGGSGGQSGTGSGGGEPEDTTGSLYSDLVIALRDENGAPVLEKYVVPTDPVTTEYCVQPVSYEPIPGVDSTVNPVDGRDVWVVPLQGGWIGDPDAPVAQDAIGACDPQPQYAMFVKEAELERQNLTRTSDTVLAQKLADVQTKLQFATSIALDPTGRISYDGTPIDASPENAAIYQALLKTGTLPGLPIGMAGPPAAIGQPDTPASEGVLGSNRRFSGLELAAMALGASASKSTPVSVDSVEYYNRVAGLDFTALWSALSFVQSEDPDNPGSPLADGEKYINFNGFTYNRAETFKGSVTWLDVPTLTWQVSHITDVVPFTNLSRYAQIGTHTLTGVVAFAQLADDVRALCNFVPDNTYIPGFLMDVPGVDTSSEQEKAIHDPAVSLGALPGTVFTTFPFTVTASLLNPWLGNPIDNARLRLTVDASETLQPDDLTATAKDGQPVPFTATDDGDLVGWWGPATGFPVAKGYNVSTTFDVTFSDTATAGTYDLTLDLVTATDTTTVLATDTGTLGVKEDVPTVLWGDSIVKYASQGGTVQLPVQVYSPDTRTVGLTLTVGADEPLTTGDVIVYGSDGAAMVPMSFTPTDGALVATPWEVTVTRGFNPVTWYAKVGEGAPLGNYSFRVHLEGGNTLDSISIAIVATEANGQRPGDVGEDTTPPVVQLTSWTTADTSATFSFLADDEGTTFECRLFEDGALQGDWTSCTSPTSYTGLEDSHLYTFSVRGTNRDGLVSEPAAHEWVAGAPEEDTTPPVVTVQPVGTPGATATFDLLSNEPGTTFVCLLEGSTGPTATWQPCTSPVTYPSLNPATYTLTVRGTDLAGNESEPTRSDSWTVTSGTPTDTGGGGGVGSGGSAGSDRSTHGTAGAGGTVSTGQSPTSERPVQTAVTTPTGGDVTIIETDEASPTTGFTVLGTAVTITAPTATVSDRWR